MVRRRLKTILTVTLLLASASIGFAQHPRYRFSVVASGLDRPVGITVEGSETIYFTLIPTPGVGGGANGVAKLDLEMGAITMLHVGEPEPVNIVTDHHGDLYWTCKSAGVILKQTEEGATSGQNRVNALDLRTKAVRVIHEGDPEPTDVAVARNGNLYWTCTIAGVIVEAKRLG